MKRASARLDRMRRKLYIKREGQGALCTPRPVWDTSPNVRYISFCAPVGLLLLPGQPF